MKGVGEAEEQQRTPKARCSHDFSFYSWDPVGLATGQNFRSQVGAALPSGFVGGCHCLKHECRSSQPFPKIVLRSEFMNHQREPLTLLYLPVLLLSRDTID